MYIQLQPLIFSQFLGIQCQICKKVAKQGNIIILAAEKGQITGFIPETSIRCCGELMDGPKLFQTLDEAMAFIPTARGSDGFVTLSPVEPDLIELLGFFGCTLEQAQELFTQVLAADGSQGAN